MRFISKSSIEYTDYGLNVFKGCPHDCRYCYAKPWNCRPAEPRDCFQEDGLDHKLLLEDALRKEAMTLTPGVLMVSTSTDPFPYDSEFVWVTHEVLKILLQSHHHILTLSKGDAYRWSISMFREYASLTTPKLEVGVSVTCLKEEDRMKWEPNAAPVARRLAAIRKVHEAGVRTWASLEPWIPDVTHPQEIIREFMPYIDRWVIGRLNHRKVPDGYYEKRLPDLLQWLDMNRVRYRLKKELKVV